MSEEKSDSILYTDKVTEAVWEDMDKQLISKQLSQVKKLMDRKKKAAYYGEDEILSSKPVDMTKEYSILSDGGSYAMKSKMTALHAFISTALEADQVDLLDLKTIQSNIDTHFKYLFLRKRFSEIKKTAPVSVSYDYDGFYVGDASFETMDEVEKAIANKAFL